MLSKKIQYIQKNNNRLEKSEENFKNTDSTAGSKNVLKLF